MDLKCLPSELIQEILDRVPFVDWLISVVLVCKEWKRLCQSSLSQNKCLIINDTTLKPGHRTKTSMIHNIVSTYQVTGLEVSCAETACNTDRPWPDVVAASKQLKWLTLSLSYVEHLTLTESDPFDIDQFSIVYLNWWQFPIVTFCKKFPKVRIFSIPQVFPVMVYPPDWSFEFAPENTEILHTTCEYNSDSIYTFLDNVPKGLPKLKKLIIGFSNNLAQMDVQELMQIYITLETYMEKKFGIRLIVRDLFVLVPHLELFKEAYYKNRLPYEYYATSHYTLFAHACYREAFDTIKFLIDSGITSFENELQFYTRTIETHKKMHTNIYLPRDYLPFFLANETFRALEVHNRKAILDYFISQGLTCATKGKKGEIMHEAFGVSHPVVAYVTLRSPPKLAAATIYEIMSAKPQHYRTYLHELYYKASKETQEEVKKLLQDFDFSNVLFYVVESRDLQLIRNFVEEFTIDLNKYKEAISECPAMEECSEVQDYINAYLER